MSANDGWAVGGNEINSLLGEAVCSARAVDRPCGCELSRLLDVGENVFGDFGAVLELNPCCLSFIQHSDELLFSSGFSNTFQF